MAVESCDVRDHQLAEPHSSSSSQCVTANPYPVFPTRQICLSTMSFKGNDRDESAATPDLNANNETCATLILKFWFSCQLASRFV